MSNVEPTSPADVAESMQHEAAPHLSASEAQLTEGEMVSVAATIRNNLDKQANLVMVDLGVPPRFELQTEDLQGM